MCSRGPRELSVIQGQRLWIWQHNAGTLPAGRVDLSHSVFRRSKIGRTASRDLQLSIIQTRDLEHCQIIKRPFWSISFPAPWPITNLWTQLSSIFMEKLLYPYFWQTTPIVLRARLVPGSNHQKPQNHTHTHRHRHTHTHTHTHTHNPSGSIRAALMKVSRCIFPSGRELGSCAQCSSAVMVHNRDFMHGVWGARRANTNVKRVHKLIVFCTVSKALANHHTTLDIGEWRDVWWKRHA